jgi:hypothetical protein
VIFKVESGAYVISSYGNWLPGNYEDERTARYAFRFDSRILQELQERINYIDTGEGRPITFADLKATRRDR